MLCGSDNYRSPSARIPCDVHRVAPVAKAVDPVETLAEVLSEHGPLPDDDIARRLRDAGVPDPDPILRALRLENDFPARRLVDERWVWLPTILAGRVFTHRVTDAETAFDMLTVTPDLDPITALGEHEPYDRLADGSVWQTAVDGYDDELIEERGIPDDLMGSGTALLLEPGTLQRLGVTGGDLVGVRLGSGGLAIERVDTTTPEHDGVLRAGLSAVVDADEPTYLPAAIWTTCVGEPDVFTEPSLPLRELLDGFGLTQDGDWVAPGGFDFDAWRFERRCELLAERHQLDIEAAAALGALIRIYEQIALLLDAAEDDASAQDILSAANEYAESFVEVAADFGAALSEPALAEALVAETVDTDPPGAAALGLLAEILAATVPRAARVAASWLRSVALQRLGDIDAAERELLAAESMDSTWPLPLLDLARIASDRGDAERGLTLLRRAGADPDHPLLTLLEQHRSEPRRDVGRNDPCWCGSGRKYKKCHLGREELPLAARSKWLYAKAVEHVLAGGWDDLLFEVGYERCRYVDPDDEDALPEALADPLVMDAVLFEGGAFAEFLQLRGSLLPDDERSLAEQWLLLERSVFEVEAVRRGHGMTMRDVRTGDVHDVHERTASRQLRSGDLVCARVVPAGEDTVIFGGIEPVALHARDQLIDLLDEEPDPATLVAELSRRLAPPSLVNTEGEPLTLCEATVQVSDPTGIATVLDQTYDRIDGDEPPQWMESTNLRGGQAIRATLTLAGDALRVETNSAPRMDRVLETLTLLDPAMRVLDDVRHPMRDAREAATLADQAPTAEAEELDHADPAVAAALDQFIRDYETRWLDEAIPALDGFTPRQAADDPTRRADLMKLLDSFPAGAAVRGGMDADRLRTVLGLR